MVTVELLPTIYNPKRGPRPIDQACPRCGADPGWRCRDQRARQRGTATKQTYRPHPERCGRQGRG